MKIKVIGFLLGFSFAMLIAWLGGHDFNERSPALASIVMLAFWAGITVVWLSSQEDFL